jgi:hypothetical protein
MCSGFPNIDIYKFKSSFDSGTNFIVELSIEPWWNFTKFSTLNFLSGK